ncbi:hypothetical protein TNCV_3433711 [Trichonephila clavipes]|nr:hypothetical protein TNCV_3433711 [Trichonephila clavipes]
MTARPWTFSMQRSAHTCAPMNLQPTYTMCHCGTKRQYKNPISRKRSVWGDVAVANPVLSWEEPIHIYFPFSRSVIAVFPFSERKCIKRHRTLPTLVHVLPTHNRMKSQKL